MKKIIVLVVLLYSTFLLGGQQYEKEISYLLDTVKMTECKYERNGDLHDGYEASEHMNNKYNYYKKKIKTAEDFIRLCATKSTMTGKKYRILCKDDQAYNSDEWMNEKLEEFRSN